MRHYVLTRSAYGPSWSLEANRRRLRFSQGVTIPSMRAQTTRQFTWLVLLHPRDALLEERQRAFQGAEFLYLDADDTASRVAYLGYGADWRSAIGSRDDVVAMTRLDDDDAFAPWAMERVESEAGRAVRRAILMLPIGIRVWRGRFTVVRHLSNAMHTLVTPPGDTATVYDYGHRDVRQFAPVALIDSRVAWLWSRHPDTISGWRVAQNPLTPQYRALFPVDWSLFGEPEPGVPRVPSFDVGRVFR